MLNKSFVIFVFHELNPHNIATKFRSIQIVYRCYYQNSKNIKNNIQVHTLSHFFKNQILNTLKKQQNKI